MVASKKYLEQAAKMCLWPVNVEDKTISVHDSELADANDDLTVMHLLGLGFNFQVATYPQKRKPFTPVYRDRIVKEKPVDIYIGRKYSIESDGGKFEITARINDNLTCTYINRNKPVFVTTIANLERLVSFNSWRRISE